MSTLNNLLITNFIEYNVPLVNTTSDNLSSSTLSRAALITIEIDPNPSSDWNDENTPPYFTETGQWTICTKDLKISGYSGTQGWSNTENSGNPTLQTKYYNGYNMNEANHPFAIGSPSNSPWSPYQISNYSMMNSNGNWHQFFSKESTKTNGDQASVNPYNSTLICSGEPGCGPGGVWSDSSPNWTIEGALVQPGSDAASLWDDKVKHVAMYNTLGYTNYDFSSPDSEYYDIDNEIGISGTYGLPNNKVYVLVVFENNVEIDADTTINIDIDGLPKWYPGI